MTSAFPALLYSSPGVHKKPGGGTYTYISVQTRGDLEDRIGAGWFESSAEAIVAAGDRANGPPKIRPKWATKKLKKKKPAKPLDWREQAAAAKTAAALAEHIDNAAPPTRAELESKAAELGIRFDGRTKEKKLSQLIQDRLGE